MRQPAPSADFDIASARRLEAVRKEIEESPDLIASGVSLCRWMTLLSSPPYLGIPSDERLLAALSSPRDNPAAWCKLNGCSLAALPAAEFEAGSALSSPGRDLGSVVTCLLEKAVIRRALDVPKGSARLSIPYEVLHPLGWGGLANLAADEELMACFGGNAEARTKVEAEASRLGVDPAAAASGFDWDRTGAAISQAGSLASLEACTHTRVNALYIDLAFSRPLQVIGRIDPAFTARQLDPIGNPAIVAATVLEMRTVAVAELIALLAHLGRIFNDRNTWNKGSSSWVILLEIES